MPTLDYNPKLDAYIQKAKPFAQPILTHLRDLVHTACPDVEETIKWGRPFFEHRETILCTMAGFKEHCTLMFWGKEMGSVLRNSGAVQDGARGKLQRVTSLESLPSDKQLLAWIREATANIESGNQVSPIAARGKVARAPKPALKAPAEFTTALRKNKNTASRFAAFSPSCKREYIEWIADAKRPETRDKRITSAIELIAKGKQRNWKYQKRPGTR
jgi:uncharacterized protein YdeI (YjbR/CyaY-like superfamily)